jgi:hypothetical protein
MTSSAKTSPHSSKPLLDGTRVHALVDKAVKALNRPELHSEVSFLAGGIVERGTPGSVRLDAVIMRGNQIQHIFDLKTGAAGMSPARIQQIYSQLGGQRPPIHIIQPRSASLYT